MDCICTIRDFGYGYCFLDSCLLVNYCIRALKYLKHNGQLYHKHLPSLYTIVCNTYLKQQSLLNWCKLPSQGDIACST